MNRLSGRTALALAALTIGCGQDEAKRRETPGTAEPAPPPAASLVEGWMLEPAFNVKAAWVEDVTGAHRNPYPVSYGNERIPVWNDRGPWVFKEIPPECSEEAPSLDWAAYRIWIQQRTESVYLTQGDQRRSVDRTGDVVVVPHKKPAFNGWQCGPTDTATRWVPVRFQGDPWRQPRVIEDAPDSNADEQIPTDVDE